MAFKGDQKTQVVYSDPEALFADIKQKKSRGPLSHQADIIRNYMSEGLNKPDISIQLATGAGKTLIGVLIGEWLRQQRGERVVYLCPTNQLVNQVSLQAREQYGIENIAFVGPKSQYSASDKSDYQSSRRIAITSYSALFNSNPFFSDPTVIILDDVHQAEGYINSMWSLRIQRDQEDHEPIYEGLLSLIQGHMPLAEFDRIIKYDEHEFAFVDKLPSTTFQDLIPNITDIIESHVGSTDQVFAWKTIRNNLAACHFYYSINEILIKPLYPPTFAFPAFAGAKQRIYMSATLGNGGDLERIVGRQPIYKLSVPDQWSERVVGRRFFCFPEVALTDDEVLRLVSSVISKADRTVYIAPSWRKLEQVQESLNLPNGFAYFTAGDVEENKSAFTSSKQCVLLLANRYDGIDFPDNEARILVIDGLPKALNLQESFLIHKLGLSEVFQSKTITRITQAFGRTTRSTTDFSVVVVIGDEIINYLQRAESRNFLLPELRAEIEFGFDQAVGSSSQNTLENIELFLGQGQEWKAVDSSIIASRDRSVRIPLPRSQMLLSIVENEIKYNEFMWTGNYSEALSECKNVLGKVTSPSLRGLRGLWSYLAGVSTHLLNSQGIKTAQSSKMYFGDASKAALAISWLHRLKHDDEPASEELDPHLLSLVDRLESEFIRIGTKNAFKIDKIIKETLEKIDTDESKSFEQGQVLLGRVLGFDAGKEESDGSPDPWWIVNDNLCFIFEDYTEGLETSELNVTKARQAASHPEWARAHLPLAPNAGVLVFLIGKISKASPSALLHLSAVGFWATDDFRSWSKKALGVIRELWAAFPGPGDMFWRQRAIEELDKAEVSPRMLCKRHSENSCDKVLTAD